MNNTDRAWEFYLQGYRLHRMVTRSANREACDLFREAFKIRPDFARAYGMLSFALLIAWLNGWDTPTATADPEVSLGRIGDHAATAVGIDESDYDNHWSMAAAHLYGSRYVEAFNAYDRAIRDAEVQQGANVNQASLRIEQADAWLLAGRPDKYSEQESVAQAIDAARQALDTTTNAPSWFHWTLGWAYYEAGYFEDETGNGQRAVNVLSRFKRPDILARKHLIAAKVAANQIDEARILADEYLTANPSYTLALEDRWPYRNDERRQRLKDHLAAAGMAGGGKSSS